MGIAVVSVRARSAASLVLAGFVLLVTSRQPAWSTPKAAGWPAFASCFAGVLLGRTGMGMNRALRLAVTGARRRDPAAGRVELSFSLSAGDGGVALDVRAFASAADSPSRVT